MSYGKLISIRIWGIGFERVCHPADFRSYDPGSNLLERFAPYSPIHAGWETKHAEIAAALEGAGSAAESVIVIRELLDENHYDDERYIVLHEEDVVSELRETVFRRFEREINEEMAGWLQEHKDPEDKHLEEVICKFEKEALRIFKAQYEECGASFDRKAVQKPRRENRRARRYRLPKPFDHWDNRNPYQQYYFLEESKTFARGGSGGSSQRGNHSVFELGFALYDSKRPVPTHILVYDSHNEIKLVDSLDRLCLVRRDLGSNYDLDYRDVDALRRRVLLCDWESSRG